VPTLVTDQGIVHYETYGRGRPVILLHGWLGSWALWRNTIEELGKDYKTYALDFFGFGDSVRSQQVSVDLYIDLVYQFMEKLGIVKAPLIGHSMGGTVALGVAARYPSKVVKTIIIGSPIVGSSLNPILKLSGYQRIANLVYTFPFLKDSAIYVLTRFGGREGAATYRMVAEDAGKVAPQPFFQSIGTLRNTNLVEKLPLLQIPILGIYGKRDIIVDPRQGKLLLQYAPSAQQAWFEGSGHFPMMDERERFHGVVREFLEKRS
jgi:pimeloyl-ACP methyl ester carboxylesterase